MDHGLLIPKEFHKEQDQQDNHEMAMDLSSMTMNFKCILKKTKSQMATTMVYSMHNTTMIRFGF
jgi:hypothetical protein